MEERFIVSRWPVTEDFQVKDESLFQHHHALKKMLEEFNEVKIKYVPREWNTRVDNLSKIVSSKKGSQFNIIIWLTLSHPKITCKVCVSVEKILLRLEDGKVKANIQNLLECEPVKPTEVSHVA